MAATLALVSAGVALASPYAWWLFAMATVVILGLAGVSAWAWSRGRKPPEWSESAGEHPLPPLIFPARRAEPAPAETPGSLPGAPAEAAETLSAPTPETAAPLPEAAEATPAGIDPETDGDEDGVEPDPTHRQLPRSQLTIFLAPTRPDLPPVVEGTAAAQLQDPPAAPAVPRSEPADLRIRFSQPGDGTLQLLPGRLEVLGEFGSVRELRFVRPTAGDPVVTFGRREADAPQHVQLEAPTVSRSHARMTFFDGLWHIVNLSRTNPVVINGQRLNGKLDPAGAILKDGDRIEMGEIAFRFRMP